MSGSISTPRATGSRAAEPEEAGGLMADLREAGFMARAPILP
jgi:hypothetical protein